MSQSKNKILILKAQPNSLKAVELFLRNRELNFFSTSEITQALTFLIQEKPQFFFVAADHPNRKIRSFLKIVSKAFDVSILGFTEFDNSSSIFALQELATKSVIYPPVSGPSIVRAITRIEKDIEKRLEEEKQEKASRFEYISSQVSEDSRQDSEHSAAFLALQELLNEVNKDEELDESSDYIFIPSAQVELGAKEAFNDPLEGLALKDIAKICQETIQIHRHDSAEKVEPVGMTSQLACLVIDTGELRGYLLVAFGAGRSMDENFMESLRSGFIKHLQIQGTVHEGRENFSHLNRLLPMQLKTKEVNFLDWAQSQAKFYLKTNHGENEVVAAFLPNDRIPYDFKKTNDGKMFQVEIDQIVSDQTLDFDLFVYLSANEKYVLYNKKGRTMSAEQKKRLLDRGVAHVHFLVEEMSNFYRYQAQDYVNSQIKKSYDLQL